MVDRAPRSQMDNATEALALSLGISRDELMSQIIAQCLSDLPEAGDDRVGVVRLAGHLRLDEINLTGHTEHPKADVSTHQTR